jgi:hypothetical protein
MTVGRAMARSRLPPYHEVRLEGRRPRHTDDLGLTEWGINALRHAGLLLAAFLFAADAQAQIRPGLDLRVGAAVPWDMESEEVSGFPGEELSAGPSFTVHVSFPAGTKGGLYLGFAQHQMECAAGCADAGDVVSTSWALGARVEPLAAVVSPWLRLGLVFDRSEGEFLEDGALVRRVSGLTFAPEVGLGLTLRASERLYLSPGARYIQFDARFPDVEDLRIKMLVVDLGFVLNF